MDAKTAWLKPPARSGGLDHLGIQQTPARIFSTLLPGLTVVTDRVSNYSFYPWVTWAYEQGKDWGDLDFVQVLRRSECLLTLVAERHAQALEEYELFHSRGLVGRNTLAPALREHGSRPLALADLAAQRSENEGSYFKNKEGGLGQYYLGPLRELGVLRRTGSKFECSEDIGVPLARALEAGIDRNAFLRIVRRGIVDEKELDKLAAFCPCHLAEHAPERDLLIELLFANRDDSQAPDEQRRQTLLLLLHLAKQRSRLSETVLDGAFRAACLTGALDDGSPWLIPEPWREVQRAWATYERNDELAIAVLGIFWSALCLLGDDDQVVGSSREAGQMVALATKSALGERAALALPDAVARMAGTLPPLTEWMAKNHEFQRSHEIQRHARQLDVEGCLAASVDTLLALAARHSEAEPYRHVGIPPDYLHLYPLNLTNFHRSLFNGWRSLSVAQWTATLAAEWGIEEHLRVALRKMHGESQDKFLLYVTDEGIRRRPETEPPLPSFTASRLDKAVQFLVDLGLLSWERGGEQGDDEKDEEDSSGDRWIARITDRGSETLEELNG